MGDPDARCDRHSRFSGVRFGPYDLNLTTGELHKSGCRVHLQEQSFQILRMLVESPGMLVSREDIRNRLWPNDITVDFDQSINTAIKRLRDTLRDSADQPRYIETLARRGYRFIARTEPIAECPGPPEVVISRTEERPGQSSPAAASRPFELTHRGRSVALCLVLLASVAAIWLSTQHAKISDRLPRPLMRFQLDLGSDVSLDGASGGDVVLSPDGSTLVYVSKSSLHIRRLDRDHGTALAGTTGASSPFLSPDGQWIAFFAEEKLKKVPARGGPVSILCDAPVAFGGSWGEDGSIVAGLEITGLSRIPSSGGAPERLTELAPGEAVHRWPQVLPGGRAVLFTTYPSMTGSDGASVEVISLADRRRKTLQHGAAWGQYVPEGYLLFLQGGELMATKFDPERLQADGLPQPVLEGVENSAPSGSPQLSFSQTGSLVYRSAGAIKGLSVPRWMAADGSVGPPLGVPADYVSPALAPGGERVALVSRGDIWVQELRRQTSTRLTAGGGHSNPVWTPDGRHIAFRQAGGMFAIRSDATGVVQPLMHKKNVQVPWSFAPGGNRLAFVEFADATGADIWTVPVDSDGRGLRAGQPELVLGTQFNERAPAFSPDGRWLAYASDESGKLEVYVRPVGGSGTRIQVSRAGEGRPVWSRGTSELFFIDSKGNIMAASYRLEGNLIQFDEPRLWSRSRPARITPPWNFDVAPDGNRILALIPADAEDVEPHHHVTFLLNFLDDLDRRTAAR